MPSSHLILCHPLLLLPLIPPSIRVFSNESTLRMRWPKSYIESISKFHCLYLQSTSQVFLHHPTSTHSSLVQAAFMSDLGDCSIFLQDLLVCPDSVEVALNVATSGFLSPPGWKPRLWQWPTRPCRIQFFLIALTSSLPRLFLGLTALAALESLYSLSKEFTHFFCLLHMSPH